MPDLDTSQARDVLVDHLVDPAPQASPIARGWRGGAAGVKSSLYGAGAAVASAVGAQDTEKAALDAAAAQSNIAEQNAQSLENVDWTSPASIFGHFQYLLGAAAPSLATMAAGAVTGRLLGGLGAKGLTSLAARESAKHAGTLLGAVAPDVALETGSIYPEALKTGVENPTARAFAGGSLAASLDFIPLLAAEKYLKASGKGGVKGLLAGAAKGAPLGAGLEGLQEAGQSAIERAAAGQPLTGDQALSDYINSFAGGAAPGLLFGAGAGALHGRARAQVAPSIAPQAPEAPPEVPAPLPIPLGGPALDQQASDTSLLGSLNPPDALPPAAPDAGPERAPVAPGYRRAASPAAADADFTLLDNLTSEHATAVEKRAALPQELAHAKSVTGKAQRELDTQIGDINTQIGVVQQQIRNRQALQDTSAAVDNRVPRSPSSAPVVAEQQSPTDKAELAVAKQKRAEGQLVSAREASLLRAAEKVVPKPSSLVVEQQNAPRERFKQETPERRAEVIEGVATDAVARHKAGLTFRKGTEVAATNALNDAVKSAAKSATIDDAEKAIYDAAITALSGRVNKTDAIQFARLVASDVRDAPKLYSKAATNTIEFSHWGTAYNSLDPKRQGRGVKGADTALAQQVGLQYASAVVRGTPYREDAVQAGRTERVGSLNADKVYTARNDDPLLAKARSDLQAKGIYNDRLAWMKYTKMVKDLGYDAMLYGGGQLRIFTQQLLTTPAAHITDSMGASEKLSALAVPVRAPNRINIGLNTNDGVGISVDAVLAALEKLGINVEEYAVHPSNTEPTFVASLSRVPSPEEATSLAATLNQEAIAVMMGTEGELFGPNAANWRPFNPEFFMELDGATAAASNYAIAQAIDRRDKVLSSYGEKLVTHLRGMIGDDPNLEVRLFTSATGDPIGEYSRTNTLKSVVSLALNAKDALSVADHEGFHYLEDRVLDGRERIVISRELREGGELYRRLIAKAAEYDTVNKTNLVDEINSNPKEARAYGYEFWRRGELQVEGTLAKIFEKIRQFLERVRNYIDDLGFTSTEDIFESIAQGQYAQRAPMANVVEADTDWFSDVEPDVVPELRTLHKKDTVSSKAKGRPFWVKTGADVSKLRATLKKLAVEGEVGKQWHEKSAAAILSWANGDKALAAKMAALIANFSPRTPVGLDLKKAFTAFIQFEAKQELNPGAPKEHTLGAHRILTGIGKDNVPAPLDEAGNVRPTGIKRENFFKNLMLGIDPKNYNSSTQGATIDMWMAHAFGYANDVMGSVTKSQYNYADAEVKRLARELGWSVEETQAAIWVAIKARGNSSRSLMERHALNRGWYEQVSKANDPTENDLLGEHSTGSKRVVKDDKQRAFVQEWMRMSLINPISQEQLAKANYDYAQAFEDIYAGKIDLSARLDELPYQITKPSDQDQYELTRQPTLFSRGATADANVFLAHDTAGNIDRRMAHSELGREQAFNSAMRLVDDAKLSGVTLKQAFGAIGEEMSGGVARWMMSNITTQNYISRFSRGFRNVYQALSAYVRYKALLISEGSRVQLSHWMDANQDDTTSAFDALLKRTVGGFEKGSAEYTAVRGDLTGRQRAMFDQAGGMIENFLNRELAADEKTFKQLLGPSDYEQWRAKRTEQVKGLINSGYIPERRHGDFTVTIYQDLTDADGKTHRVVVSHEQFEREAAAIVREKQYTDEVKKQGLPLSVIRGTRHNTAREAEISIQQFLDTARRNGVEITQLERERLAKSLTAADSMRRNRLIHRENVPGMSRDGTRVLNEFVVTMANKIAYSEFSPAINSAAMGSVVDARTENNVPTISVDPSRNLWHEDGPQAGFYRNKADELTDYVLIPDHTGAWSKNLRGAAMGYFIGGSLAAAVVNTMSIPMVSVPALSQYTTYTDAVSTTLAAWRDTWVSQDALRDITKLKDKDGNPLPAIDAVPGLRAALVTAAEDGRTMDTEIHQIMGLSQGGMLSKSRNAQRVINTWMAPFKVAEQTNRITTFISAYKIGQKNNLSGRELYDFAAGMVDSTQNRYDEVNRPAAARNPIWAIMFMFKSFPLFMTEAISLMYKQNPKSAVYLLLGLTVLTGVQGLPFAEDILDLIDTISQRIFGSPFNSRRAIRNLVKDASEAIVGADLSEVVLRGVINSITGMNISSRVGMGDMLPGTRIGAADGDYGRTVEQLLGAPVAMTSDVLRAGATLAGGVFGQQAFISAVADAAKQGGPSAVRNAVKGLEQFQRGYATDAKGRKLVDTTTPEAFWQAMGFSSAGLNKAYELDKIDRQTMAFYSKVRTTFTEQLTRSVIANDPAKAQETMDAINAWNTAYPDMPVSFNAAALRRSIVEAGLPLNERTLRQLPKQLRGTATGNEGSPR